MKRHLAAAAVFFCAISAQADWYSFYAITANDSSGYAQRIGESQLFMGVTVLSVGQVSLVFTNTGPADSVVSRIYFDALPELDLGLVSIKEDPGVAFAINRVRPGNLPAGNTLSTAFVSDLAVAAENPSPHRGINPYESLELIMSHDGAYDVEALFAREELRVGLHVISLGEYSESFINNVPEPATLPLIFLGSIALRWLRIKREARHGSKELPSAGLTDPQSADLQWQEIKTGKDRRRMPLTRCEAAIRQVTA
jgi:hypothetical protein